jgi:hypothetical protein
MDNKDGLFIEDFVLVIDLISRGSIDGKSLIESFDIPTKRFNNDESYLTSNIKISYRKPLDKFFEDNAEKIADEVKKPKPVFYYKVRLISEYPQEKAPDEEQARYILDNCFGRSDYSKSMLKSRIEAETSVTLDKIRLSAEVLILEGTVRAEIKEPVVGDWGSTIYEKVTARGGEKFGFGDISFMNYAWSEWPDSNVWDYFVAARACPEIAIKFHSDKIVFKAKQIDPNQFLNLAAIRMFPITGDRSSIKLGELFQSYFKLVNTRLPNRISSDTFEFKDKDLNSYDYGLFRLDFTCVYDDEHVESMLKQGLKDVETMRKCLNVMLKACQEGQKASPKGSFIDYVRELFKTEISSDPLKYSKGRWEGHYSDEIRDAAKCILGTVDDEDEDD